MVEVAFMETPEQLLSLARERGASDAEVYATTSRSRLVTFEGNRLKQLETVASAGVGLRVWRDGRCGLAVAYGPHDPEALADKAIALSQLGELAPVLLADTSPATWALPPLDIAVDALVEQGQATIASIRNRFPDVICNGEWTLDFDVMRLLNSRGLDCQFSDSSLSASVGVEWVRGDDFLEVGTDETVSPRQHAPVAELHPELWTSALARRLHWATRTLTPSSGHYPVIFTPNAVPLLLETAISATNGRYVAQKTSPWSDKLGQPVAASILDVVQQPSFGPFGTPFDDEGLPSRRLKLLESGELHALYCDLRAAHDLGLSPTGNGFRSGLGSYPAPGLANLVLPPATLSFNELLRACDRGLVVDRVLGGGGGLTGDFSCNVDLGFWVEAGEIVGRVKDTLVAGNAYTALKQITAFSSAPVCLPNAGGRTWAGSIFTPAIAVSSLSVTGQ
ncbi:MAG: TldD/PmbA family protein [Cyanobacteria bacterium P01_E01_bin.48]